MSKQNLINGNFELPDNFVEDLNEMKKDLLELKNTDSDYDGEAEPLLELIDMIQEVVAAVDSKPMTPRTCIQITAYMNLLQEFLGELDSDLDLDEDFDDDCSEFDDEDYETDCCDYTDCCEDDDMDCETIAKS